MDLTHITILWNGYLGTWRCLVSPLFLTIQQSYSVSLCSLLAFPYQSVSVMTVRVILCIEVVIATGVTE